jgi:hypothetical protein
LPHHDRRLDLGVALTGGPPESVREVLDATAVVVALDPSDGPAAVQAAAALVSMSARVVGHVIVGPVPLPQPNPWGTRTLPGVAAASRLDPPTPGVTTRRITVRIGGTKSGAAIYVGGDDWTAIVSRDGPVDVGPCTVGGPGLHVAVALAFGEVLKDLLGPIGMRNVPIAGELTWNLVDGGLGPAPALDLRDRPPEASHVALLGSGSVGSSAAAVLAITGLGSVVGSTVEVIDPDRFSPRRNGYRCPGVPAAETGSKAEWAARVLGAAGWSARPDARSIADWHAARPDPGYPGIALVSVDNVDGRRDAGDVMAATTVSSGISGAALHVQRHHAVDDFACPYCEFVDARQWREQAEVYARLGLTVTRLQALLGGAKLTTEDVATAIWTGAVEGTAVHDLPGGQLIDLIARHYATVAVRLGDEAVTGGRAGYAVSAPHVSWLAGTLLAAEVAKAAMGIPGLDRRVELDLTGVPLGGWRRPPRDPSGRCPCTSPPRRDLARSLYGR